MAQQKRRKPVQHQSRTQPRTWTMPRILLLIGYGLVFAFLGILFLMRQELVRVGIFGDKPAASMPVPERPAVVPPQVTTEAQRPAPPSPPQVTTEAQSPGAPSPSAAPVAPRRSGEITTEEKQALDDILRSKR